MEQYMPFPGYAPSSVQNDIDCPPCSGYVGQIVSAKIDEHNNGKSLCLTLDIVEGRYSGWFQSDYEHHKGGKYPARHHGRYRLFFPKGDGSERDGWTIDRFNRAISSIQKSNPGFEWSGNTSELIGKAVGFVIREAEWNGHVYIEIGKLITVNAVRSNNYKMMPRRVSSDAPSQQAPVSNDQPIPPGFTIVEPESDLPF